MAIYCTQKIVLCLVNSSHLMTEATNNDWFCKKCDELT